MKKRDLFLIVGIVLLIAAVAGIARLVHPMTGGSDRLEDNGDVAIVTASPTASPTAPPEPSHSPAEDAAPEETGVAARPTLKPAKAYLRITVNQSVSTPLALTEETEFKLALSDGGENIVHITEDSVWMASANCADQSCVEQGTVSLENRDTRVLMNMIVCLPHGVILELLTPEEAQADWEYWYGVQEQQ